MKVYMFRWMSIITIIYKIYLFISTAIIFFGTWTLIDMALGGHIGALLGFFSGWILASVWFDGHKREE